MSQERTRQDLIELQKPCEKLCMKCGAECCRGCKDLKDGRCADRNEFCLLHYCDKMEKEFPDIVNELKKELLLRYPMAARMGIMPRYKWTKQKNS